MSLTRRVVIGCVAVAVVLFVADVVLAGTFRSYLVGRVDAQLVGVANQIGGRGGPRGGPPGGPDGPGVLSTFYVGIAGPDGEVTSRLDTPLYADGAEPTPDPEDVLAAATPPGEPLQVFTSDATTGADWRMVALEGQASDRLLVVGVSLGEVAAVYERVVLVLAIATGAVLLTLAAVAAWVLRQGVRPLVAMTATADAIADGALSARVADTDARTEAGRLGRALNVMLARIEAAFAERSASEARLRQFVADASHELRTPLTSIRGYADLYRHGGLTDPDDLDGAMGRVEQEATRMGGLVDDLLLLARLDQGRPLERAPVHLERLVDDAVRDARAVEPGRPLHATVEPVAVVGDEARLRQVVGNLLANTRVHTPPGTRVEVTLRRDGDEAVLTVSDDGPGVATDVVDRVFERFVRADVARTRANGGSGLGLAIVASVVTASGGTVAVDSDPGRGARFTVRLPVAGAVPATGAAVAAAAVVPAAGASEAGATTPDQRSAVAEPPVAVPPPPPDQSSPVVPESVVPESVVPESVVPAPPPER